MKTRLFLLFLICVVATSLNAGSLFYAPIAQPNSDANSGISTENGYTTAIDGGNTKGTDRVIGGITLYSLAGSGQSASADNCTLNALSGALTNSTGSSSTIAADGILAETLSDMTFNANADNNSQQEIVLDAASLTSGVTYDLRVYICNASSQNRQINLSFAGDGQAAVETGLFNEDDARTSSGRFTDPNQVYYIDYRYTWDGDTTPGITITQTDGRTPFVLYALTNQEVPGGNTAAAGGSEAGASDNTGAAAGLTMGDVGATPDQVGVSSDTFYNNEALKSNGDWVDIQGYGRCWHPTRVSTGWRPYTNGGWRNSEECGWTWVSEEPWSSTCDHYGRWCNVQSAGWCWVPGTVWSSAWVSWRQGRTDNCSCVGWAPLPPEAACDPGIGVGTWVDHTCDIGPDNYTFINIRDFGSDSFSQCGCIYESSRNVTIIDETTNITNISYNSNGTYCGGPDYNSVNSRIKQLGGREIGTVHVNRVDHPVGPGKYAQLNGNQLSLTAPKVVANKQPANLPKVARTLPKTAVDHGWSSIKDPKVKNELKQHIALETQGKNPKTAPARLPASVAQQIAQQGNAQAAGRGAASPAPAAAGQPEGAKVGQVGHKGQGKLLGQTSPAAAGAKTIPGAQGAAASGASQATAGRGGPAHGQGALKHPGSVAGGQSQQQGTTAKKSSVPTGQNASANAGVQHPGQSISKISQAQRGAKPNVAGGQQQGAAGGKHPGQGALHGQGAGQSGSQAIAGGQQGSQAAAGSGQGPGHQKGTKQGQTTHQQSQLQGLPPGAVVQGQSNAQQGPSTAGHPTGGTGGAGKSHTAKGKIQQSPQGQRPQAIGGQPHGIAGGGQQAQQAESVKKHQAEQQQQQLAVQKEKQQQAQSQRLRQQELSQQRQQQMAQQRQQQLQVQKQQSQQPQPRPQQNIAAKPRPARATPTPTPVR